MIAHSLTRPAHLAPCHDIRYSWCLLVCVVSSVLLVPGPVERRPLITHLQLATWSELNRRIIRACPMRSGKDSGHTSGPANVQPHFPAEISKGPIAYFTVDLQNRKRESRARGSDWIVTRS